MTKRSSRSTILEFQSRSIPTLGVKKKHDPVLKGKAKMGSLDPKKDYERECYDTLMAETLRIIAGRDS